MTRGSGDAVTPAGYWSVIVKGVGRILVVGVIVNSDSPDVTLTFQNGIAVVVTGGIVKVVVVVMAVKEVSPFTVVIQPTSKVVV